MSDSGFLSLPRAPGEPHGLRALQRMRLAAGALLGAMILVYLFAVLNHQAGPVWGYVRAFAEAAMVGGLADWFAVTALFRHPLGIPIPHTAVIPKSKNRIAEALGQFVALNFLAADVVAARLQSQNLAGALARQLAEAKTASRVAQGLLDAAHAGADLLEDEVVGEFLRRQIEEASRSGQVSAAFGRGLKLLADHGRHEPLLDAALAQGWRMLEQNEPLLRAEIRAHTSWMWRLLALDTRASDALIEALQKTLQDVARDRAHPLRQRAFDLIQRLSHDLEHSPTLRAEIERFVTDALQQPAVKAYLDSLWNALKASLQSQNRTGDGVGALADAISGFGRALLDDAEVQASLNQRLRALLAEISGRHGGDVAHLISDTIRGWDARTVVAKLEENVGADLQIIRINGTLIGGLIGLLIHQTTLWLT